MSELLYNYFNYLNYKKLKLQKYSSYFQLRLKNLFKIFILGTKYL